MSASLVLEMSGWCLMRIPTDPDPTDEPRGASGYTFAFAGEPDLDRLIYWQPPDPAKVPPRLFAPEVGVTVKSAERRDGSGATPVPALVGAKVDLLDGPVLENRNWTLTLPGFEPIVPFHLQVATPDIRLYREAPLDPQHPDRPVWQVDAQQIAAQSAAGMAFEPGTVGRATGIWDALEFVKLRHQAVKQKLEELERDHGDAVLIVNLRGRLAELDFAVANPGDRRVLAKSFVERFGFPVTGSDPVIQGSETALGGKLDPASPWMVTFWIGGWDPDALCAFLEGSLTLPYAT